MSLAVRVRGRLGTIRRICFPDDTDRIVIGRNPARCQVLFSQRTRHVGYEHCALSRVLGRYRLVLNGEDEVYVDGAVATDGDELPAKCLLRLGRRGPRLALERSSKGRLGESRVLETRRARFATTFAALRWHRIVITLTLLVALAGLMGSLHALKQEARLDGLHASDAMLQRAAPSVYRTLVREDDGSEHGGATAFVVAPGTLATNVHVADRFERLGAGTKMLVRSGGADPQTHEVLSVVLHPGEQQFEELWKAHRRRTGEQGPSGRTAGACDVALLRVAEDADLGPALPLANDGVLMRLRPGQPVAYIGYPSENLLFGGSRIQAPVPQVQRGNITALTSVLGEPGSFEESLLVQHSCPGAGGASGSPVLDAAGRVVAILNAGNHWHFGMGGRTPSAALVSFAQRIDLLRELLDGTAADRQPARTDSWRVRLEELLGRASVPDHAEDRKRLLESVKQRFEGVWSHRVVIDLELEKETEFVLPRSEPRVKCTHEVALAGPHHYVLVGWPADMSRRGVGASIHYPGGTESRLYLDREWLRDGAYALTWNVWAAEAGAVRFEAWATDTPASLRIEVFRVLDSPQSRDITGERLALDWCREFGRELGGTFDFERRIHEYHTIAVGRDAAITPRVQVYVPDRGLYVFIVIAPDGEDIEVASNPAWPTHKGRPLHEDVAVYVAYSSVGHYSFEVRTKETDVKLEVRGYRISTSR